ncbi:unnamed protein product [Vitrella brassicaformis CCMP3155]|uniref:Uncharacterized protein n=1 Tax=Vitrella brassicaformis (strain CCMP3155) TaxID=1169540 RepID=A0A0G4ELG5_VITBC|nr:unnamed protein product [Vitrella brassicaformis CCMP3155]|eukprot:CEL97658.1 unnamed protein product [Vitrella brassicaformis CCMP3155]
MMDRGLQSPLRPQDVFTGDLSIAQLIDMHSNTAQKFEKKRLSIFKEENRLPLGTTSFLFETCWALGVSDAVRYSAYLVLKQGVAARQEMPRTSGALEIHCLAAISLAYKWHTREAIVNNISKHTKVGVSDVLCAEREIMSTTGVDLLHDNVILSTYLDLMSTALFASIKEDTNDELKMHESEELFERHPFPLLAAGCLHGSMSMACHSLHEPVEDLCRMMGLDKQQLEVITEDVLSTTLHTHGIKLMSRFQS